MASQARPSSATSRLISAVRSSFISPATGRATRQSTAPPRTTTRPPPHSAKALAATAISRSSAPTTSRLWASWATVLAMAPSWMPNPVTKPRPVFRFPGGVPAPPLENIPLGIGMKLSVHRGQHRPAFKGAYLLRYHLNHPHRRLGAPGGGNGKSALPSPARPGS